MAEFYDREKLYKEVWEAPMIEVCKQYGISDVALSKICKKLKVPKPPAGYWAKKAAGKAPSKPRMYPYNDAPKIPIRQIEDPKPRLASEAFEEADKLTLTVTEIIIPEDLENLHPYVRNTRKVFKRRLKKQYENYYNRISVSGDDAFDINIGLKSLDRASLILQSLCASVLSNGFKIVLNRSYGACFQIMRENIAIKISESTKRIPNSEKGMILINTIIMTINAFQQGSLSLK